MLACHAPEKGNKEEIIERQKQPRSAKYSLWFITKAFPRDLHVMPHAHRHTQPRKIMRKENLQFASLWTLVSFRTFIPIKIYSHCISVCIAILSPLDDTVSAWKPELEYQESFSTVKVMWKKIAAAPAHTILVSSDFCTIQSCLLKDSMPQNLNISAAANITDVQFKV